MSELLNQTPANGQLLRQLLATVSTVALIAYIGSTNVAKASEDRPTVWLELGGQLEFKQGDQALFSAPFMFPETAPADGVYGTKSFLQKQKVSDITVGGEGKLTFQPEGSDWMFMAQIRYGRSKGTRHKHYQGPQTGLHATTNGVPITLPKYAAAFSDTQQEYRQSHYVLDFQAGKDVGLGLFGSEGTSTVSAGVRIAQFSMQSHTHISARPFVSLQSGLILNFNQYFLSGNQTRSFHGIGPSLAWSASAVLAGNPDRMEFALDWGIDGALLFGRQKAKTDHQTSAFYEKYHAYQPLYPARGNDAPPRSRQVTVPEIGGFIGLSAKLPHSKVSLGYRGDIWFGAIDKGLDVAQRSNLFFHGPYASISIGLP